MTSRWMWTSRGFLDSPMELGSWSTRQNAEQTTLGQAAVDLLHRRSVIIKRPRSLAAWAIAKLLPNGIGRSWVLRAV